MPKRNRPSGPFACQKCSEDYDNWHELLRHNLTAHSFCLQCNVQILENDKDIQAIFDHMLDNHCKSSKTVGVGFEALREKLSRLREACLENGQANESNQADEVENQDDSGIGVPKRNKEESFDCKYRKPPHL